MTPHGPRPRMRDRPRAPGPGAPLRFCMAGTLGRRPRPEPPPPRASPPPGPVPLVGRGGGFREEAAGEGQKCFGVCTFDSLRLNSVPLLEAWREPARRRRSRGRQRAAPPEPGGKLPRLGTSRGKEVAALLACKRAGSRGAVIEARAAARSPPPPRSLPAEVGRSPPVAPWVPLRFPETTKSVCPSAARPPPVTVMAAGSAGSDCHVCLFFLQRETAGPPPAPPRPGQCPPSCPCPSSSRFVFSPPRSVGMGCMSVFYAGTTTTF